jgi:hypothetical protein
MRPRPTQVTEQLGVGAAGILQGVGEDGQAVEGALLVDGLREFLHQSSVQESPGRVDDGRAEPVAEDIPRQGVCSFRSAAVA